MGRKKDLKILREFKEKLSKEIPIKKIILFGSRAKRKIHRWSDFDLVIVSKKFRGIKSYRRGSKLYDYWQENYPVDFLCYTPEEFNRLKKQITIVKEAIETGIEIR